MRNACRRDDEAEAVTDVGRGPVRQGSTDVFINGRPAVHITHAGYYPELVRHGPDVWWNCTEGVILVLINGQPAVGVGCRVTHAHARGVGVMATGSGDVLYGGATATMEEMARADALAMFDAAEEALTRWDAADRAKFKRWFGDDSEEARREMLERFRVARARLRGAPLVQGDKEAPAYTHRGSTTVHLCDPFWQNPDRQDRAGTLFHEGVHLGELGPDGDVVHPDDSELSPAELEAWAQAHPDEARNNGHSKRVASSTPKELAPALPTSNKRRKKRRVWPRAWTCVFTSAEELVRCPSAPLG